MFFGHRAQLILCVRAVTRCLFFSYAPSRINSGIYAMASTGFFYAAFILWQLCLFAPLEAE